MTQVLPVVTNNFDLMTLILEFNLLFKNFNLADNFWMVSATAMIFHINIPCDNIFLTFDKFLSKKWRYL